MRNTRDTKLLFELSEAGRRSHRLPACDVPERPVERTAAGQRTRRCAPCPARAERAAGRAAFRESLAAQHERRHAFLSARLLHDEVQPEAERARRPHAGLRRSASVSAGRNAARHAAAAVRDAGVSQGNLRPRRLLAAAGRRRPRRAHRPLGRRRLFPRSRRKTHQSPRARQRPRHQPRQRHDGRLRNGHRENARPAARSTWTTSAACSTTRSPCS